MHIYVTAFKIIFDITQISTVFYPLISFYSKNRPKRGVPLGRFFSIIINDYQAFSYKSIKSCFVTSLGFPGLQGSSIALSASIAKSFFFAPTSFTV